MSSTKGEVQQSKKTVFGMRKFPDLESPPDRCMIGVKKHKLQRQRISKASPEAVCGVVEELMMPLCLIVACCAPFGLLETGRIEANKNFLAAGFVVDFLSMFIPSTPNRHSVINTSLDGQFWERESFDG